MRYKKAYGLYLAGKRCIFLYLHLKKLAPGRIWTHTVRAGEGATTLRVSAHSKKRIWSIFDRKKVYFLIPTPEKFGTWWDLNPHCSGGWRCNHITRISPLAKYPKFSGVTAICRGSMTGKVLTRQLNGKTESGWDLNTHPLNTAKVTLHYALLCLHQVHQVSCRYCRASRHRYRKSTKIYIYKNWEPVGIEHTLFVRAKVQPHYAY